MAGCCSQDTQLQLIYDGCSSWGDRRCRRSADQICEEDSCKAWASYWDHYYEDCGNCDASCIAVIIGTSIGIILIISASIYSCCFFCPCCPLHKKRQVRSQHYSSP